MKRKWIVFLLRIVIGAIFVYAGILKIKEPQSFADSIATFRLLPKELVAIFALTLPPFEIVTGTLLILGRYQRAAALGILLMTSLFAIALIQGMARGLEIDCGCFGGGTPSTWKTSLSLGRDLVLIVCTAFVYLFLARQNSVKSEESLEKN